MQRFTRWANLSETAFLLTATSPDADYRVRIFTLARELPFAGHPTLGSCHAWLTAGGEPSRPDRIVQECGAGLVPVRRDNHGLAFAAPPLVRTGPVDDALVKQLAVVLGIDRDQILDTQWVDNGPGWVAVLLRDADAVLTVEPDFTKYSGEGSLEIGLVGTYPPGAECAFEVRGILSDERGGMIEDPVTGSLNASLGQWLLSTGRATAPYVASQGTRLGRRGRPRIDQDSDGTFWVGGSTVTYITGDVELQVTTVRGEIMSFSKESGARNAEVFTAFWQHPFLRGLHDGTVPRECVIHYVGQDHQYLNAFIRCYGAGIARSPDRAWMAWFHTQIRFLLEDEQHPHHVMCHAVGISYDDVRQEQLGPSAQAYVDHMESCSRDTLGVLLAAMLPCPWTYVWAAVRALSDDPPPPDNPFRGWWEFYGSTARRDIVADFRERVDALADEAGTAERDRMARAFDRSRRHEVRFWEMAWSRETWALPEELQSTVGPS